jgi:hypothetical protein
MRPVESIPEGEIKENGVGVNSNVIYLIHCKNSCKCHNVSLPAQQKWRKKDARCY